MDETETSPRTVIRDATCLGCGCLCDDIVLAFEGETIIKAGNACPIGRSWYGVGRTIPEEGATIDGRPVFWEEALDRAAEILSEATSPLVWGLSDATIEAQRIAVSIADRIGAYVGIAGRDHGGLRPYQRLGEVSATLGEIRDRADLIVYDLDFPIDKLPRFRERYAEDSPGRFILDGRGGRTVIALRRPQDGSLWGDADLAVDVRVKEPVEFYAALRATLHGVALDPSVVERQTGTALETFADLADRLKRARYGVFCIADGTGREIEREAILALVRDLNAYTRFVAVHPPAEGGNRAGAGAVLAWQAGAAGDVDFALGYPRHLPGEDIAARIGRGEVDAALLLTDSMTGPEHLPRLVSDPEAVARLGRMSRVVIRPGGAGDSGPLSDPTDGVHVVLPTARPGIDEGGTVARFDGVMLPLRPPFPGRRPSQVEVLRGIESRIAQDQAR